MSTLNQSTVADQAAALYKKMRDRGTEVAVPGKRTVTASICSTTCDVCHGLGFVRYETDVDHPYFGKLFPCPNVPNRNMLHPSGIYLSDLDTFHWNTIKPFPVKGTYKGVVKDTHMDLISQAVLGYLTKHKGGMVYLYGNYGMGKSLILRTAVADLVRKEQPALYTTMGVILDDIKMGFDATDPRESSQARYMRTVNFPFLAIDEIEKIQRTDWAQNKLFQFIDTRYEQAMHESTYTLLASNVSPDDITPALASRINDGRCFVVELSGTDARPTMSWEV